MDTDNKFIKIQEYYNKINKNLENMSEDVEKLDNTHKYYLKSSQNVPGATDVHFHYSVYIDDIFFQKNILQTEYNCMNEIYLNNLNKLYRDLYKLFNKIIKLLINLVNENNKLILKINDFDNTKLSIQNTDELRKKYYINIKIYHEINSIDEKFLLDDVKILYDLIIKRNIDINDNIKQIRSHIASIDKKISKGIFIETFKISLIGTIETFSLEYNLYIKIFNSILNNHILIANKYFNRTKNISEEVTFDEETNSIKGDNTEEYLEFTHDLDHQNKIKK